MAPKTMAKVQHPTQLIAKIVSVRRKPLAKNPRFSPMTCHFQNDSMASSRSGARPHLESEEPLAEVDRADDGQGEKKEQERARRVGLEAGERLFLDLLRIEHQIRDGDGHGDG